MSRPCGCVIKVRFSLTASARRLTAATLGTLDTTHYSSASFSFVIFTGKLLSFTERYSITLRPDYLRICLRENCFYIIKCEKTICVYATPITLEAKVIRTN